MALLEVVQIDVYYGPIRALRGISLEVEEGEIVTLIGSNGAGKSTTLKCISGLMHPAKGEIRLSGRAIHREAPHRVVELGICQSPEGRRIFPRMTVLENLEMGAYARKDSEIDGDVDRVFDLFPRLRERRRQMGGTLSGGEQQMLAIGRALMARPRVLLLDEPSMGLAPMMVELILETVRQINEQGTTVLLVEQNAVMALKVASRGYVLESGAIILHDTAENLRQNEIVRNSYLGID